MDDHAVYQDGFLTGRAIVTSVGVFTYRNKDGEVSRELRPPEEVFAADSLNSMKLKPMTNNHPAEKVTPVNAKTLQTGSLGNNPSNWIDSYAAFEADDATRGSSDGFHVSIDMAITDAAAIQDAGSRRFRWAMTRRLRKALVCGAAWLTMPSITTLHLLTAHEVETPQESSSMELQSNKQ